MWFARRPPEGLSVLGLSEADCAALRAWIARSAPESVDGIWRFIGRDPDSGCDPPSGSSLDRAAFLRAGVPQNRITVRSGLTEDVIAAEAPGQSYENQPGQPAWDSAMAPYGEAVRSGACVVSVFARSEEERQYVEQLLLKNRARVTALGAERGNNRR